MLNTTAELIREQEEAQRALEEITQKVEKAKNTETIIGPVKTFAVALHNKQCHSDHMEYCGFHYGDLTKDDTWRNEYSAQAEWLTKAEAILAIVDLNTAYKLLKVI